MTKEELIFKIIRDWKIPEGVNHLHLIKQLDLDLDSLIQSEKFRMPTDEQLGEMEELAGIVGSLAARIKALEENKPLATPGELNAKFQADKAVKRAKRELNYLDDSVDLLKQVHLYQSGEIPQTLLYNIGEFVSRYVAGDIAKWRGAL